MRSPGTAQAFRRHALASARATVETSERPPTQASLSIADDPARGHVPTLNSLLLTAIWRYCTKGRAAKETLRGGSYVFEGVRPLLAHLLKYPILVSIGEEFCAGENSSLRYSRTY